MDITKKAIQGGFWLIGVQALTMLMGLVGTTIFARLLDPKDFGLLGIAVIFIAGIDALSQMGVQDVLIQKKNLCNEHLDAGWTLEIIRGIILFCVMFVTAPYISIFFNEPQSQTIIRAMTFGFLLISFKNTGIILFRKDLEFKKQFLYLSSPQIFGLLIGIIAVFILRNVWALVIASLAGNIIQLSFSFFLHPYRPSFSFNLTNFKELFKFGKWLFVYGILFFLTSRADNILVGKMLGITALGFYAYSFNLTEKIIVKTAKVFSGVTFPVFSKIQDNISKVSNGLLRTLDLISFSILLLALCIFIFVPDFVTLFIGDKWMPIIPVVRILCVSMVFQTIKQTTHFLALGRPDISFKLEVVRTIFMFISIIILTNYFGIKGTAIGVLIGSISSTLLWLHYTSRLLNINYNTILGSISPSFIGSFVTLVHVLYIKTLFTNIGFIELFILGIFTAISYCSIAIVYWKVWGKGPINSLVLLKNTI